MVVDRKKCCLCTYYFTNFSPLNFLITTQKCVLIHSRFHYILNEFGHFYHGEIGQPFSERELVATDSELVHYLVKYKFTKPFHLLDN
jgi:hypothetical protein